jgi:hypothetical protein
MSYEGAPSYMNDPLEWCRRISRICNSLLLGRSNNVHLVTLTANSATTTVTTPKQTLSEEAFISFMPTTANAATEFGAGIMYVSARDVLNDQFTITHANNAQNDRTFRYVLIG